MKMFTFAKTVFRVGLFNDLNYGRKENRSIGTFH